MRYYSKQRIEELIKEYGGDLQRIEVGLEGYWAMSSRVIYEGGRYKNVREDGQKMIIAGLEGSDLLIPMARCYRTNGTYGTHPVYVEELPQETAEVVSEPKDRSEPAKAPRTPPKRRAPAKKKS